MKNISSLQLHRLFDSVGALLVSNRQIGNEFLSQISDFPGADLYILLGQFRRDFTIIAMSQKQCLANMNQNVIAKVAARCNEFGKFLRVINTVTLWADRYCFPHVKWSDVQSNHFARMCFSNVQ